jgi:hypothetical protein
VLLAGFFTVSSLYISAHRLFWFDEILTALCVPVALNRPAL